VKRGKPFLFILSMLVPLMAATACEGHGPLSALHCLQAPYSAPPTDLGAEDLAGTWETSYGTGVDRLILRTGGTFRQVFERRVAGILTDYAYETPWNEWRVERFSDGRVQVHMQGARYYLDGVRFAELDGTHFGGSEFWGGGSRPPYSFYDPFAQETVYMIGELILNVRADSTAQLLLHHMWSSSDRGFVVLGCEQEQFRRVYGS
jgi:hypothetical protein